VLEEVLNAANKADGSTADATWRAETRKHLGEIDLWDSSRAPSAAVISLRRTQRALEAERGSGSGLGETVRSVQRRSRGLRKGRERVGDSRVDGGLGRLGVRDQLDEGGGGGRRVSFREALRFEYAEDTTNDELPADELVNRMVGEEIADLLYGSG